MKFLIDAQLPRRMSHQLNARGFDATHTLDLATGNRTTDSQPNRISVDQEHVLVTKDTDFVDSLIVQKVPYKLLLISTGNIKNVELETMLFNNLELIVKEFKSYDFIEIDRSNLRFHF